MGRRHARHILFAAGSDDAAAEANAKRAYERAVAGEDFAALARELSEDPGSKDSGGDLGEAERADFVGPFGDAVWSMKPGEIRGPVKTEFGWHVIKLESASPETTQSFEDVRAELEPEFRHAQVEKAFGDAQEELDTTAFEAQGDIGAVASKLNLPVKHIERYTRAGSAELGAAPKVTEAVFAADVIAGRELRTVEIAPGKVVALGVKAHQPARPKPLEEVRAEVVESARLEAAGKLAAARAGEIVAELEKGAAWPGAARPLDWRGRDAGPEAGGPPGSRHAGRSARRRVPGASAGREAALRRRDARERRHRGLDRDGRRERPADREDGRREARVAGRGPRPRWPCPTPRSTSRRCAANSEIDINPKVFE